MSRFRELPIEVFEQFHRDFQGDTFDLCAPCGGCEYALVAALLPGEARYMALKHPEAASQSNPLRWFRETFVDGLVVDGRQLEAVRFTVPCPFLAPDTGRCTISSFKPVLCEIYPLGLSLSKTGELVAQVDPWCPLSRDDATVARFREKWARVAPLFSELEPDWVRALTTFDDYTYDSRAIEAERRCPSSVPCRMPVEHLHKHRISYLEAQEARALFSGEEVWRRLQGELLHCLQTDFPTPICTAVRSMLETTDPVMRVQMVLQAGESIAVFCALLMLTHYTRCLASGDIASRDAVLSKRIMDNLQRPSFGKWLECARDLARLYTEWDVEHFVRELPEPWTAEVQELMADIVKMRGDVVHQPARFKLTPENAPDVYATYLSKLLRIVHELAFLRRYAIVCPYEKKGHTANLYVARGVGTGLLRWQGVPFVGDMELEKVYLLNIQTNEVLPLWPFYRFQGGRLFLCYLERPGSKSVCMVDEVNGESTKIARLDQDIPEFLAPLSPDYEFQKDDYLRGYDLRLLSYDLRCEIASEDGDLRTSARIEAQCIKCPPPDGDARPQCVDFDYHDCPDFPIDDETFDLQVRIDGKTCTDTNVVKTIWNPGFRKFAIDLGRRLGLHEKALVEVGMFEPQLMNLWPADGEAAESTAGDDERSDYYEVDPACPTEKLRVTMVFPLGYRPANLLMEELGRGIMSRGKVLRDLSSQRLEDGRYAASYELRRPTVENTYILRFDVERPAARAVASVRRTRFEAGLDAYTSMSEAPVETDWVVVRVADRIIVQPFRELLTEHPSDGEMLTLLGCGDEDRWLLYGNQLIGCASEAELELRLLRKVIGQSQAVVFASGFYPGDGAGLRCFRPEEPSVPEMFSYPEGAELVSSLGGLSDEMLYFPPGSTYIPDIAHLRLPGAPMVFAHYPTVRGQSIEERVMALFGKTGRKVTQAGGPLAGEVEFLVVD